jgi:hypothetical protein
MWIEIAHNLSHAVVFMLASHNAGLQWLNQKWLREYIEFSQMAKGRM